MLSTDAFGRRDFRTALCRSFEVDRYHVMLSALQALAEEDSSCRSLLTSAIERYGIDSDLVASWMR